MAACVGRAPYRLRAFAATTGALLAVGLCILLLGLTRAPGVDVGSTFQFIPRAIHPSAGSSVPITTSQAVSAGDPTHDVGDEPPRGVHAALPTPVEPGPDLLRHGVVDPSTTTCLTRTAATVGCRGPPA